MSPKEFESFEIKKEVPAEVQRVFAAFIDPQDLKQWHHAGDWTTPLAEVEARIGGKIKIAYADPTGVTQFDLVGTIEVFDPPHALSYRLDDGRMVRVGLEEDGEKTLVRMEIDAEPETKLEHQVAGWGMHLENLLGYLSGKAQ